MILLLALSINVNATDCIAPGTYAVQNNCHLNKGNGMSTLGINEFLCDDDLLQTDCHGNVLSITYKNDVKETQEMNITKGFQIALGVCLIILLLLGVILIYNRCKQNNDDDDDKDEYSYY